VDEFDVEAVFTFQAKSIDDAIRQAEALVSWLAEHADALEEATIDLIGVLLPSDEEPGAD